MKETKVDWEQEKYQATCGQCGETHWDSIHLDSGWSGRTDNIKGRHLFVKRVSK